MPSTTEAKSARNSSTKVSSAAVAEGEYQGGLRAAEAGARRELRAAEAENKGGLRAAEAGARRELRAAVAEVGRGATLEPRRERQRVEL